MNLRELQAAIAHYGNLHPDGGTLGIVVHDHRLEHDNLELAWGRAAEVADGDAIRIVNALRVLTRADRELAVHPIACRSCGHSEASHALTLSNHGPAWGAGPCAVEGCDCGECDA